MLPQNFECTGAVYHSRFHIQITFYFQDHTSCQTGIFCPAYGCDGDDSVSKAWAKHTCDCDCQDHSRERDHHICDSHDHLIDPAAEVSCNNSKQCTYNKNSCYQDQGGYQRGSGTIDHTGKNVSSQFVSAKGIFCTWGFQRIHHHCIQRILWCDPGSKNSYAYNRKRQNKEYGKLFMS